MWRMQVGRGHSLAPSDKGGVCCIVQILFFQASQRLWPLNYGVDCRLIEDTYWHPLANEGLVEFLHFKLYDSVKIASYQNPSLELLHQCCRLDGDTAWHPLAKETQSAYSDALDQNKPLSFSHLIMQLVEDTAWHSVTLEELIEPL